MVVLPDSGADVGTLFDRNAGSQIYCGIDGCNITCLAKGSWTLHLRQNSHTRCQLMCLLYNVVVGKCTINHLMLPFSSLQAHAK